MIISPIVHRMVAPWITVSLVIICISLASHVFAGSTRPNIVLILADDLGWSDLGCYGADLHETPNLDRLAAEGIRFTQAYAMSVCSPSRATLMTGVHAARIPITIWAEGSLNSPVNKPLIQARSLHDLPHDRKTIATRLRELGYATACIGKWHLGQASHFPQTHGFDVAIAGNHWGAPQSFFWPYRGSGRFGGEYRYVPNLEYGQPNEYLTDRLTDEAIQFIDHSKSQPFFLYLAHYAPHTPIEAPLEDVKYFDSKLTATMKHRNATYAAMIKRLDIGVGRIVEYLKQQNLDKKTILIFASDNGGFIGTDRKSGQTVPVTNNAPLRSGKGSLYEGGIRIPLIVHCPSSFPSGALCSEPVVLTDLAPTILNLCQSRIDEKIDGINIMPLLQDPTSTLHRRELYFHYPHYYDTTTPAGAVREGKWKLLEYFEDSTVELYDLEADPEEKTNRSIEFPLVTQRLLSKLHAWRQDVHAEMPSPRPK